MCMRYELTNGKSGHQFNWNDRWSAIWKESGHVLAEGQTNNAHGRGPDDDDRGPGEQESRDVSQGFFDITVFPARFPNHRTQLRIW